MNSIASIGSAIIGWLDLSLYNTDVYIRKLAWRFFAKRSVVIFTTSGHHFFRYACMDERGNYAHDTIARIALLPDGESDQLYVRGWDVAPWCR